MSKANRFEGLAVDEEPTQQQPTKVAQKAAVDTKKKFVVKVKPQAPANEGDQEGFEKVDSGFD